jgi:threonine dehydratase
MSATYESPKPDGYLSTRNNVYLDREKKQEIRTFKEQGACRDLHEQSMENYGKKGYK